MEEYSNFGFVYLLYHPHGLHKIGIANSERNLKARVKAHRNHSPYPIYLKSFMWSSTFEAVEKELLERYQHAKVRGEWFNLSPIEVSEVLAYFAEANKKAKEMLQENSVISSAIASERKVKIKTLMGVGRDDM